MGLSKRRLLLQAALLVLLFLLIPYFFLMALATTKEFKGFAQKKASEFLRAPVKIGKIRVGFLGDVILSNFEIADAKAQSGLEIGKIIFRYNAAQLLSRNYQIPAAIVIQSPTMRMNQGMPFGFFQNMHVESNPQGALSELELAGGEIHYAIPFFRSEIILHKIEAVFRPRTPEIWRGTFRAQIQGLVEAEVSLRGEMNLKSGERQLRGEISRGKVSEYLLPEKNSFIAQFEIQNDQFLLQNFLFKAKTGKAQLTGKVDHFSTQPRAELSLETKFGGEKSRYQLAADFEKEILTGDSQIGNFHVSYQGRLQRNKNKITLLDWKSNLGSDAGASIDFDNQLFNFNYSKDQKRLELAFKLQNQNLKGALHADHFDFMGIDLVSAANFELTRDLSAASKSLRLDGSFKTDYFILDTVSLDDFSGEFKLTTAGFPDLRASWGKNFKASGSVRFGNPLEEDLTVYLSNLNLNGLKRFAAKPLPKDMGGVLNGQIRINGSALKPHFLGYLTVRDGWLGKVDFETAQIQFSGLAPVFDLKESRVYRGRGALLITGKVNLQAQNILSGIRFETQDHIVLYRGLDVTLASQSGDLDMEVHPGVKRLPAFGIRAGSENKEKDKEETSGEKILQVGPRFRF